MSKSATAKKKNQGSLTPKTQALALGLALTIIGSLICSSFAKDTLTNYFGFSLMLTGIGTLILSMFATVAATLKARINQLKPEQQKIRSPHMLIVSVWSIGVGVFLASIGFMLSNTYAKFTMPNDVGYQMLLGGALVILVGITGAIVSTGQTKSAQQTSDQPKPNKTLKIPRGKELSGLLISAGIAVTLAGSLIANSFPKQTIENYVGFGTLLSGVAILCIGVSQLVVTVFKNRWNLAVYIKGDEQPRVMLGSIWAIGIGTMLVINGSLLASSYEKSTLLNFTGFGMLLAGTGVFVYGMFFTARISALSAMGYLSKRTHLPKTDQEKKIELTKRMQTAWRNLVKTSAVLNLGGVVFSVCLLFFSLWQLDLIVSGPVWWSDGGVGWSYRGPGPYADKYFQCFIWQTTIGQAYDTFFMLIFISFIILFASTYFWPRFHSKQENT